MTKTGAIDTSIRTLGTPKLTSRLPYRTWVDDVRLPIQVDRELCDEFTEPVCLDFEAAGPRKKLYFDPSRAKCAIVTCGGLCPGLNDVIRAIVMEAHHAYHVPSIMGIRYGLEGFIPACGHQPMELTPERVADIHRFGGTILGSSRGPQSAEEIVDSLERSNVSILFVIGGDGSMKAALSISREVQARNLKIAVIGIPKTIDNDINFIPQSFGFETAVYKATEAIECAHTEARGMPNGIGLVKLMGRESGFIAAQATLAMKEVNFVLVPEAPFTLEGEGGLLPALEERLKSRHHAVIVAAEGARPASAGPFRRHRRLGQPAAGRRGRPAALRDQALYGRPRHPPRAQVHRPQLHHPLRAGHGQRQGLLRLPGPVRRPCGHGRAHRHGGGQDPGPLRASAAGAGDAPPPQAQHLFRSLARRPGIHGTGHAGRYAAAAGDAWLVCIKSRHPPGQARPMT